MTLTILTLINCLGVKLGSRVQSGLMVLKIGAIAFLVARRAPSGYVNPMR